MSKLLDSSPPTLEYLTAFHRFVSSHPLIYGAVKEEIHRRARGSAGGQAKAKRALEGGGDDITIEDILEHPPDESSVKVTNAAPLSGILAETDDYIDTSVVIAKEGVFTGTDSQPRFKPYDALAESSKWFLGTPITNGHIPGEVQPETRRIGHIINVQSRPDTRDVFGTARFFKNHLSEDELTRLRSGAPIDGSIGYKTPIKYETGRFNDDDYVGIETGPFILDEYAILPGAKGACSSEMGCGIFQNAAPNVGPSFEELMSRPASLELVDGKLKKRCPKLEADQMTEEIATLKEEFTKQLNAQKAAYDEIITGQAGKISELTTKLDGLATEHKTLNEAFTGKVTAENVATEAANKKVFGEKNLNAAAMTELDAIWLEVKGMNPAQYDSWKVTNSGKLLTKAEETALTGKKQANAAGSFDLAAEQAKIWGY